MIAVSCALADQPMYVHVHREKKEKAQVRKPDGALQIFSDRNRYQTRSCVPFYFISFLSAWDARAGLTY